MKTVKYFMAAALATICANAFEYNVTKSAICPRWQGAVAGEWTMDREAALAKAKSEGAYAIVMFTGSWWCPYCENLETKVLKSQAWADYVAKRGYYLVVCDFPYRFPVPAGQEWKGTSPLGNGWGFQCWLYDADYLAANGLTAEDGLAAIQALYDYQDAMALPGSTTDTISRYGGGTMELHKIKYPTMILFRPDGTEAGRVEFPTTWVRPSSVSDQEAIEYMIGNLEKVRVGGKSDLFINPGEGGISGEAALTYDAVLTDSAGVPVGMATVKTTRKFRDRPIKVSANVQINGRRRVALRGTTSGSEGEVVNLVKDETAFAAKVIIGSNGLVGSYTDGTDSYNVQGARNVFKAKDADAMARAATLPTGRWPIVLETADNGGNAFANGYSTLSASVGNGGKVKVTGILGNGQRATISAKALMGENGKTLVPVMERKGAYSFILEFDNGQLKAVTGLSDWKSTMRNAQFTAKWSTNIVFTAASDSETVPATMYLQVTGSGAGTAAISPTSDMVVTKRNKWTGTKGVSDLHVTFKPFDGTFRGTSRFQVPGSKGTMNATATLSGVVVNGVPYGTAVIRGVGSWAIKLVGSHGGGY